MVGSDREASAASRLFLEVEEVVPSFLFDTNVPDPSGNVELFVLPANDDDGDDCDSEDEALPDPAAIAENNPISFFLRSAYSASSAAFAESVGLLGLLLL